MDGQRFDELTRLIGSGTTRRRILKLIGGGAAAGLLRPGAARAGFCTGAGDSCAVDQTCCSQSCVDEVCQCSGTGSPCIDDGDCCANNECIENICSFCRIEGIACEDDSDCCVGLSCDGDSGLCAVSCGGELDRCVTDDDCCAGYACVSDGGKGLFCFALPAECEIDGDCDPCYACEFGTCVWQCETTCGVCNEGVCGTDCRAGEGDSCCGAGEICNQSNGVCDPEAPEAECEVDADCVVGAAGDVEAAICCAGACRQLECCIDDADPNARCADGATCFEGICVHACKDDADCAGGACCCEDGSCYAECCGDTGYTPPKPTDEVTTLPNTGVAGGGSTPAGLLGAGLIAGAAAYLAGKKPGTGPERG